MEVVWDVENKVTYDDEYNDKGKKTTRIDPLPFNPKNYLVSVGAAVRGYASGWRSHYWFLEHNDIPVADLDLLAIRDEIQALLDATTIFIAHNAKYDLQWLWAAGFKYDGKVYDTMLGEYVWARGQKIFSLSLAESAKRRNLSEKRTDLTEEYWSNGIGFEAMPLDIVEPYGRQDCVTAGELYDAQILLYYHEDNAGLTKTLRLMNEFCLELSYMEYSGINIDMPALDAVEQEYREEKRQLIEKLETTVRKVMGDRIINLDSPEQMSMVIFSRAITDKRNWGLFWLKDGKPTNRRINKAAFKKEIQDRCYVLNRQKSTQCQDCKGKGFVHRTKKNGELWKKPTKCNGCEGIGLNFRDLSEVAGFKFNPPDANWITANGFATDKEHIEILVGTARAKGMKEAEEFLSAMIRLNAVNTYLDSFISGIKRNVRHDNLLHAAFNQTRTSTGRLSSSGPNMQNMPRGATFPVKRAFTSRFVNGKICEGDFSQLEFRSAGELSGCEQVARDIREGVDVHAQTAKAISDAGQPIDRQEAKPRCVPMYTQALTKEGWKYYQELSVGEEILVYDQKTNTTKWSIILELAFHPKELTKKISNSHWEFVATGDHRWYGSKRVDQGKKGRNYIDCVFTTDTFTKEHRLTTSAYCDEEGIDSINNYAYLLGWLWTDGTIKWSKFNRNKRKGVSGRLIQKKYTKEIEENLSSMMSSFTIDKMGCNRYNVKSESIRAAYTHFKLKHSDEVDYVKFILSLSASARKEWLSAVILAEGGDRGFGVIRISQNSGNKCEAIKLAAYLEGYDIRVCYNKLYTGNINESITLRTRPYVTGQRIKIQDDLIQDVWCPRTTYGTWVAKQLDTITISGNTFRPLYGGTTGTPAEIAYIRFFMDKYSGIAKWHGALQEQAIALKKVILPTGREYAFPYAKRNYFGGSTSATKIKNYPVQGFATADIVPWAAIRFARLLRKHGCLSVMCNTVHDSIVADVHPDELDIVPKLMHEAMVGVTDTLYEVYGITLRIPLAVEIKLGDNWLEGKRIY